MTCSCCGNENVVKYDIRDPYQVLEAIRHIARVTGRSDEYKVAAMDYMAGRGLGSKEGPPEEMMK